jgi:hypothetical protein
MRKISSFVIIMGLVLAATGFGVWAASRTTNHANVQDTHGGIPAGGGIFIMPAVY